MTAADHSIRQRTLADYVALLRRRKWVALVPVLLVPVVAFAYSYQQPKLYSASAEVLLSQENLGTALSTVANFESYSPPDRYAETQAVLARVPEVAQRAVADAGVRGVTAGGLLGSSSVTPRGNADLLRFTVTTSDSDDAATLVTAYARAFSQYRLELDTANLAAARRDLQQTLVGLRREGQTDTPLYRELSSKAKELRTIELLQRKQRVVKTADEGSQVAPTPKRSAILGLALGLLLGLGAAFLWEALDKRVRDEEEIQRTLGLPLLARVPPPRQQNGRERLAMLDNPSDAEAEAVRRLRSNIEFANLDDAAKVIMVTSALSGEGKSTIISNLALALARSGRRVVLVDLDLRKPAVARLFGMGYRPGLTDVAIERVELERALIPVSLEASTPIQLTTRGRAARRLMSEEPVASSADTTGHLWVLPAGFLPANPGELVGTQAVANILAILRERVDFVLVDAPPLLAVSDAVTLSRRVDAILLVSRLGMVNRPVLNELTRQLESSSARKLGFVLSGVDASELYGLGAYQHGYAATHEDGVAQTKATAEASREVEDALPTPAAQQRAPRWG